MKRPEITGDIIIAEAIERHPELVDVLFNHGIQCFGCGAATAETLEEGYRGHYGPDADVASFLKEMNDALTVEACGVCHEVSSWDGPLFQMMFEGDEQWICKTCLLK